MWKWLCTHIRSKWPSGRRTSRESGKWAIWMYESPKVRTPLLLFVYEWERAGFSAPWVNIIYSNDENQEWGDGDLTDTTFEEAPLFCKLIESGEARRVGPVPFDMPPPLG